MTKRRLEVKVAKQKYKSFKKRSHAFKQGRLKLAENLLSKEAPKWGGLKVGLL